MHIYNDTYNTISFKFHDQPHFIAYKHQTSQLFILNKNHVPNLVYVDLTLITIFHDKIPHFYLLLFQEMYRHSVLFGSSSVSYSSDYWIACDKDINDNQGSQSRDKESIVYIQSPRGKIVYIHYVVSAKASYIQRYFASVLFKVGRASK